ncbi:DUF4345 family protein [Actinoplanes sp. NBC_00393]|uniref:DUF4345 family protein n=1 Tax=Actinoplanes sp. NBC_00393 TaxID=2975953 RepID=UPI002E213105
MTRATGGGLIGAGALILTGAFSARFTTAAAIAGTVVYLGFGLGRLVSTAVDGSPGSSLILAAVVELGLGAACAVPLLRR